MTERAATEEALAKAWQVAVDELYAIFERQQAEQAAMHQGERCQTEEEYYAQFEDKGKEKPNDAG